MVALIRELFQYQAHADTAILMAVRSHEWASRDRSIVTLFHHILVAHRFWIHLCEGAPFHVEAESVVPGSLEEIATLFERTQAQEFAWMDRLSDDDLERTLESPYLPGRKVTIRQGLTQVCLHSQWHRGQLAARLRALGGEPPAIDYILWTKDRD